MMFTVLNLIGYVLGVLGHILFRWSTWKRKGNRWGEYWGEYAGLNVGSAVAALVFFPLWQLGYLMMPLEFVFKVILAGFGAAGFEGGPKFVDLPMNMGTSAFVGFVMDSMGRTLVLRWQAHVKDRENGAKPGEARATESAPGLPEPDPTMKQDGT